MLAKLAVRHVIIGHSERRQHFGETDSIVAKKLKAVASAELLPILCVGETLDERESGNASDVVIGQLRGSLSGVDREVVQRMAIAYEPVWAIGTGRTAEPDDAGAMAELVRDNVRDLYDSNVAEETRILYGGSVNVANVKDIMAKSHIDGALVGGASLDPDKFAAIVRYRI